MTNMNEKLVIAAWFTTAEDAHLAKMDLAGAGIESFLDNANFPSMDWFYTLASRGIKLFVRQSDLESARQILQDVQNNPAVDEKGQPIFENDQDFVCPACGSIKIDFETYWRKGFFLSILFFNFPLPIKINRAVCRQCGHTWKQR
jgi:hypothetical protein